MTNSVVPIANPPMASASTARVKWRAVGAAVSEGVVRSHRHACSNHVPAATYSAARPCATSYGPVAVARGPYDVGVGQSEASASLNVADGRITAAAFAASGR